MVFQINLGDIITNIIAIVALFLSGYALRKTSKFNKRQNEFGEIAAKLNKRLLQKEEQETVNQQSADFSANFIEIGNSKHRLKIFNKGKNTARNVRIEVKEGNELLNYSDVNEKFPIPSLEQHQHVELIAAVSKVSPPRIIIHLTWNDDSGNDKTKKITCYV